MTVAAAGPRKVLRWFVLSAWNAQRSRWLAAAVAIAIGVALAVAIDTVNRSALSEFQQAVSTVNGEAQLQVLGRQGGFDEALWPVVAGTPGVADASPVVEAELPLADHDTRLAVIGLDVFRAGAVTPALLPRVATGGASRDAGDEGSGSPLFSADAIFLSPAAQTFLNVAPGDALRVRVGLEVITLRVAGSIDAGAGRRLAAMDLGSAQWRLGRLNLLDRIDLKLADGVRLPDVARALRERLPADVLVTTPDARTQRMSNVSRAYRVNLNVLALVALFTGAFLVFSAVGLSVVRQRPQLALLSVLGASDRLVAACVLLQGAGVAALGTLLGLPAGIALAALLLATVGGDLGGGFFSGSAPALDLRLAPLAGFALLGLSTGLVAAWLPAREAVKAPAATALRAGSAELALGRLSRRWPALALLAAAVVLALLPPVGGLPVAAYLSIACLLLAGIAAVPWLVERLFGVAARVAGRAAWKRPAAWLALMRTAQAPGQASASIAGVVAAFALTVAMAIMVASFRDSVARWLDQVLPADVYGRAAPGGPPPFDAALLERVRALPGVREVDVQRVTDLSLDPARAAVALLVRPLPMSGVARLLPVTGAVLAPPPDAIPIVVSEAMVDLHGMRPGTRVELPLGVPRADGTPRFFVVAVWRDYARQQGAVVLPIEHWAALGGEPGGTDLSIRLDDGQDADAFIDRLRTTLPALAGLDFRSAQDLRALSLRIFDRSFAVTYLLEAAALLVALFGVASGFAGQALARAREFGALRHLGATRRQLAAQLGLEGLLLTAFGTLWGGLVGFAISLLLIHRVNPQSFHWTMDLTLPWTPILAGAAALAASGAAAAMLAAGSATGEEPLRAVREDW